MANLSAPATSAPFPSLDAPIQAAPTQPTRPAPAAARSTTSSELHTAPPVLDTPSELACTVCGHHALSRNAPHELASVDRLYCLLCGAHRLLSQAP